MPGTFAVQGLSWQNYTQSSKDLISPYDCDFTTYDAYSFAPHGIFGQQGDIAANGLVVDNLVSKVAVTVTIGPLLETVPPYTKQLIALTKGSPLVVIKASGVKVRVSFYTGGFAGSTNGSNFYAAQLAAGLAVETGMVYMFAGSTAAIPAGYLLCDGTAVLRLNYPGLFAIIGTTYGAGDGSTTFNLPDMGGRGPIGAGSSGGRTPRALGTGYGAESVTLSLAQMPSHSHPVTDPGHAHGLADPGHVHAKTDNGHNHTLTDNGHSHTKSETAHSHSLTDNGHTHGSFDPAHKHTLNDPGHAHGISDPGHGHQWDVYRNDTGAYELSVNNLTSIRSTTAPSQWSIGATNLQFFSGGPNFWDNTEAHRYRPKITATGITISSGTTGLTESTAVTGITYNSQTTGITIASASTGVSFSAASTGITIASAASGVAYASNVTGITCYNASTGITTVAQGSGAAVPILGPCLALNFIIKT